MNFRQFTQILIQARCAGQGAADHAHQRWVSQATLSQPVLMPCPRKVRWPC